LKAFKLLHKINYRVEKGTAIYWELKLITICYKNNEGLLITKKCEVPHPRKVKGRPF
jgi:hypothetical protein